MLKSEMQILRNSSDIKLPPYEIVQNDVPDSFIETVKKNGWVAIDTETRGLRPHLHRLCTIQLYTHDIAYIVVVPRKYKYATNVCELLKNSKIQKIFHFAHFDVGMLYAHYNTKIDNINYTCEINNIYCTKIVSRIVCTYTSSHSLKGLCERILAISISKSEGCTTDWGCGVFEANQISYMLHDVLHLYNIQKKLNEMVKREELTKLIETIFPFIIEKAIVEHELRSFGYEPSLILEF